MVKRGLASLSSAIFLAALVVVAAAPAAAATSSELVNAVKTVSAQTDKLRSMMADLSQSQFQIVSVASVLSSGDEAAFKEALKKNSADIADMRDTLTHTTLTGSDGVVTSVAKLLQAQNLKIGQVVAIYVSNSQVTLFYQ